MYAVMVLATFTAQIVEGTGPVIQMSLVGMNRVGV
jgi:hypothetical protein